MTQQKVKELLKAMTPTERREFIKSAAAGTPGLGGTVIIHDENGKCIRTGRSISELEKLPYESLIVLPSNGREV